MERQDKFDYLLGIMSDVISIGITEQTSEKISAFLDGVIDTYDFSDKCYNYVLMLLIAYAEVQSNYIPLVALKFKELKAKILVRDLPNLPVVLNSFSTFGFIDDSLTKEVFKEENGAVIFKQYIPSQGSNFSLPMDGSVALLKVTGVTKSGENYSVDVEIDSKGIVTKQLSDIRIESAEPLDSEEIYSELLEQVMNFDPSFNSKVSK